MLSTCSSGSEDAVFTLKVPANASHNGVTAVTMALSRKTTLNFTALPFEEVPYSSTFFDDEYGEVVSGRQVCNTYEIAVPGQDCAVGFIDASCIFPTGLCRLSDAACGVVCCLSPTEQRPSPGHYCLGRNCSEGATYLAYGIADATVASCLDTVRVEATSYVNFSSFALSVLVSTDSSATVTTGAWQEGHYGSIRVRVDTSGIDNAMTVLRERYALLVPSARIEECPPSGLKLTARDVLLISREELFDGRTDMPLDRWAEAVSRGILNFCVQPRNYLLATHQTASHIFEQFHSLGSLADYLISSGTMPPALVSSVTVRLSCTRLLWNNYTSFVTMSIQSPCAPSSRTMRVVVDVIV